jgi:hypothetical protein
MTRQTTSLARRTNLVVSIPASAARLFAACGGSVVALLGLIGDFPRSHRFGQTAFWLSLPKGSSALNSAWARVFLAGLIAPFCSSQNRSGDHTTEARHLG